KFGRRAALTLSVAAMAIPTFLIGLLPGYATLGIWAPAALTLLRMTQGFSIGGEFTSSVVFLIERARGSPRLDGRTGHVRRHRGHSARFRRRCSICRSSADNGVGDMGLAHSLPARPYCRHRWLLSTATCAGNDTNRTAQTLSDHRHAAPSLAHCYWLCRLVGF